MGSNSGEKAVVAGGQWSRESGRDEVEEDDGGQLLLNLEGHDRVCGFLKLIYLFLLIQTQGQFSIDF